MTSDQIYADICEKLHALGFAYLVIAIIVTAHLCGIMARDFAIWFDDDADLRLLVGVGNLVCWLYVLVLTVRVEYLRRKGFTEVK